MMVEAGDPEWPFAPLHVPDASRAKVRAIALDANSRYVQEVLEAQVFCPFAREARRQSRTEAVVHLVTSRDCEDLYQLLIDRAGGDKEVVQVIFAASDVEPKAFSTFCHALTRAAHAHLGREVFALAPLHPDLGYRRDSPFTIVPLLRRAPDPTLQWVRLSTLHEIYEGREADRYVDVERLAQFLATRPPAPLYDRIAERNYETASMIGFERLERIFADIADEARSRYRAVLPDLVLAERS